MIGNRVYVRGSHGTRFESMSRHCHSSDKACISICLSPPRRVKWLADGKKFLEYLCRPTVQITVARLHLYFIITIPLIPTNTLYYHFHDHHHLIIIVIIVIISSISIIIIIVIIIIITIDSFIIILVWIKMICNLRKLIKSSNMIIWSHV